MADTGQGKELEETEHVAIWLPSVEDEVDEASKAMEDLLSSPAPLDLHA